MSDQRRALVLSALMVLSVVAAGAAGVIADTPGDTLDTTDESYQGVYVHEDTLTLESLDRGEHDDPTDNLQYDDDDGDVADLPAIVNSSQDEPVSLNFSKVEASQYTTFPRVDGESDEDDDGVQDETWSNHNNWTTSTISVNDRTIAGSVPAVTVDSNDSMTAGDTATATFKRNVSITSDVSKRVLQLGFNVEELESSANVSVRLVDDDGDYYAAYIDTDGNLTSDAMNISNSTGQGFIAQVKLSNLDEQGTVNEISKVEVVVKDADATVSIYWLDVASKSKVDLGETIRDDDGDGDEDDEVSLDEIDGQYHSGAVELTSLSTMGSWADSAVMHDLKVDNVRYRAQDLMDSGDWDIQWETADDYPSFDHILNASYRLEVPAQIDLTHGSLELRAEQSLVDGRYEVFEHAEDTGDTDLYNVSDSDFTSNTDDLANKDDEITLDSNVNADENIVVHMRLKFTDSEKAGLTSGVGGAGPMEDGGFSFMGLLSNPWTWLVAAGTLVAQRFRGGWPF